MWHSSHLPFVTSLISLPLPRPQDDPFAWLWPWLAFFQAVVLSSTALAVYLCAGLVGVVYGLYHYR